MREPDSRRAYQVALDRTARGGDFLCRGSRYRQRGEARLDRGATDPEALLREVDEAIRGNLQARASAVVHRYGQLGHPARPVFELMSRYAISEDGSLHAEKYYRTVTEEFSRGASGVSLASPGGPGPGDRERIWLTAGRVAIAGVAVAAGAGVIDISGSFLILLVILILISGSPPNGAKRD